MVHAGGRPRIFKTVEDMQTAIDEYFTYCDNRVVQGYDNKTNEQFAYISPEPYTMAGLAYHIGMDRRSLINYKERTEFFPAIKDAREKVEMDIERRMNDKGTFTPGLIFNLKNNFQWKDEFKQDVTLVNPILGGQTNVHPYNGDKKADETPQEN